MDDIEVKLSPLDEDSKQALMSFVQALNEVRASMDQIKTAFASELGQFRNVLQQMNAPQQGGSGWQTTASGLNIPGASQTPSGARSAQSSLPPNMAAAASQPNIPYVDQGGHGGTGGGGGTGDQTAGYPYPMFPYGGGSGIPSAGASSASHMGSGPAPSVSHANWYGGDLQIPRINEFNIQDYTRMAGKVIGGSALQRYGQNQSAQRDIYDTARRNGQSHQEAMAQAEQGASYMAPTRDGDTSRINIANRLAQVGQIGPYVAATQGLIPQLLGGGVFAAPGLAANMNASMGLGDQYTSMFTAPLSMGGSLLGGIAGQRMGLGNEAAYRFGRSLAAGRNIADPKAFNLFSLQERGDFAEASMQVNMRGNEFDTAMRNYAADRMSGRATLPTGQYAELFREQTRNAGTDYQTAANNLKELAASAKFAGMNVKQMGDAAQAYHAANPQLTMSQSVQQTAAYGFGGVNADIATSIVNNPYMQGAAAMRYGTTPEALAGMSPESVLSMGDDTYQQLYNSFKGVVRPGPGQTEDEAIMARITAQTGMTAETQNILKNGRGHAAASAAYENFDDKGALRRNLREMSLPNMNKDGRYGRLSREEQNEIANAGDGFEKMGLDKAAEKARREAYEKITSERYGYDVRNPGKKLEELVRKNGKYDETVQAFVKQHGLQDELDKMQTVMVEFTGKAKNWFRQVDANSPKGSGTSPNKRGNNSSPDHGISSGVGGVTGAVGDIFGG